MIDIRGLQGVQRAFCRLRSHEGSLKEFQVPGIPEFQGFQVSLKWFQVWIHG